MNEFDLQRNVPLAPLTTLGVGGSARLLVRAGNASGVRQALDLASEEGLPLTLLGGGSNVLISDRGVDALVLQYVERGCEIDSSSGVVRAAAGTIWDEVVRGAVDRGLAGIECLRSIPGAVGAAPVQNIGAYGQELADTLSRVEAIDLRDGGQREFARQECGFSYRNSHFKSRWPNQHLITGIELRLRPEGEPSMAYPSLAQRLQKLARSPSLSTVAETVREIRSEKGMVYEEGPDRLQSAGSFFTNPVVDEALADEVLEVAGRTGADTAAMPRWPVDGGRVKLSAAWLIEASGFARGHRHGSAGLSPYHVLALINRGGATAAELLQLAHEVKHRVLDRFGVTLVPEPVPLGFTEEEIQGLWPLRS